MNQNRVIAISAAILVAVLVIGYGGYKYFTQGEILGVELTDDKDSLQSELLVPGPLGDKTMGDRNALLKVIEYASLTCSHCADFAVNTFPSFKRDYIDTGKAYYIFRPFPYDPIATGAFMLAQCAPPDRYFGFIDVLFARQAEWAFVEAPQEALKKLAAQGGFTEEKFEACIDDQEVFMHVQTVAQRGSKEFGVESTPTFFINGEKIEGALPYEKFAEVLNKQLAEKAEAQE